MIFLDRTENAKLVDVVERRYATDFQQQSAGPRGFTCKPEAVPEVQRLEDYHRCGGSAVDLTGAECGTVVRMTHVGKVMGHKVNKRLKQFPLEYEARKTLTFIYGGWAT